MVVEEAGARLESVSFEVDREAVTGYCEATGHPALQAGSGAVVAPPTLASVYTYGVVAQLESKRGAILAGQRFRFFGAVQVGDRLITDATIAERYEKRGRQYMVLETQTRNQRDEIVSDGRLTRILPSPPPEEPS